MKAKVLLHASEILTGNGLPKKDGRKPLEEDLGRIEDGAIVYTKKDILWIGKSSELPKEYGALETLDLKKERSVIPGMIDCHTHLVFAGDRATEFARRCGGTSYQEIAKEGGGILTTVKATRQASEEELFSLGMKRLEEAYRHGVRTIEAKSGYGLDTETELKVLRVVKKLQSARTDMTIVPTFLGAHDFPKDRSREVYLEEILNEMLPRVKNEKLADSCDVFIDEGFYTLEEGRKILEKAKSLGMKTKIHADELVNTESAALAAELGSLSADHLLKISDRGIAALAASNTTAVVLPGTAFYLKAPHAPARKLIDTGARVAISTDFNPGTSMTLNLPAVLTISALYLGLTKAELFSAVTYNAACALGLQSRKGTLEVGKDSDFSILPVKKFEELYYRFAW